MAGLLDVLGGVAVDQGVARVANGVVGGLRAIDRLRIRIRATAGGSQLVELPRDVVLDRLIARDHQPEGRRLHATDVEPAVEARGREARLVHAETLVGHGAGVGGGTGGAAPLVGHQIVERPHDVLAAVSTQRRRAARRVVPEREGGSPSGAVPTAYARSAEAVPEGTDDRRRLARARAHARLARDIHAENHWYSKNISTPA